MLKKHINKHVKGENSQKAKKGQKRAITQLRKKKLQQIYQQKKATKEKKTYITHPLQTLHETKSTTHQAHHYPMLAHTPHTLTLTQKQDKAKTKHQNKPSSKNKKALYIYIIGKKICCPSVAF